MADVQHRSLLGTIILILLAFVFIGLMTWFVIIPIENIKDAENKLLIELKPTRATIHSPAVIIYVNTLSELQSNPGSLFYDGMYYYVIPDSYIGYQWRPRFDMNIATNEVTLGNR